MMRGYGEKDFWEWWVWPINSGCRHCERHSTCSVTLNGLLRSVIRFHILDF